MYAVEDPGYLRLTRIYQAMGCKVRHIPLDDEGVDLSTLQKSGTDVLHLMPSHQYPTGLVTSIARRYALLSWAAERPGRYLIEDDFDCEFRLAGKPIPALASIDAAHSVIYTNTFSKSLSSALRLAYMVLPDELMERFRRNLGFYASSVSSVDQVALARLLESGDYERHVNRVRVRAREARDGLMALVRKVFPAGEVSIEHADAGLTVSWLRSVERAEALLHGPSRARVSRLSISVTVIGVPMAHLSLKTQLKFLSSMTI